MGELGFLIGERIYLRPLTRDDLKQIQTWANDPGLRRLTGEVTPMTESSCEEFYEKTQDQDSRVWFMIICCLITHLETSIFIG
jgi:RimJ/RimL family protein N-acetyltransferase